VQEYDSDFTHLKHEVQELWESRELSAKAVRRLLLNKFDSIAYMTYFHCLCCVALAKTHYSVEM